MGIATFRSRTLAVYLLIACLVHLALTQQSLQLNGPTKNIGSLTAGQSLQISWSQATAPVVVTLLDSSGATVATIGSGISGTASSSNNKSASN